MCIVKQKIDNLFAQLRSDGYKTAEGRGTANHLYSQAQKEGIQKIAYYDEHDLEAFEFDGVLCIGYEYCNFHNYGEHISRTMNRLCGEEIYKRGQRLGLAMDWNGSSDHRVVVRGIRQ